MHAQKIAVVGATGRVGHHVVDILEADGHHVVPISRTRGVDVITGDGLADALVGVDTVVDVATSPHNDLGLASDFFTTATANLQSAGEVAGVQRMVVVSIIGNDRFTLGHVGAKRAHEAAVFAGPIPAHVLRAALFHEFVGQLVEWGTQGDVAYVPIMRTQLVAARTVARGLVDLATADWTADPTMPGGVTEIAGPREEQMVEAAELLVAKRGLGLQVVGADDPWDPEHLGAQGAMLPGPHATLAGPTFEEWLATAA
jgi:uncharacterized protein YbjT (DUF2867 family)